MLSQMKEIEEMPATPEPVDISIPYNAAAMLAYKAAGSKGDFADFEEKYVADTVAMVTAKKVAREGPTETKKAAAPKKEKAATPAAAAAPSTTDKVDLSIPYDAAAKLAYAASNQKMDYDSFKEQYVADARSAVMAKRDLTVNYESAALLAYTTSGDRSTPFDEFKAKYEADAVADVIAKKKAREESA
jgi:hypothetical protein